MHLERIPGQHNIGSRYRIALEPNGSFTLDVETGGKGMAAESHNKSTSGESGPQNLKVLFAEVVTQKIFDIPSKLPCDKYIPGSDVVELRITMDGTTKDFTHDLGCESSSSGMELQRLTRVETILEKISQSPLCRFVPAYCQLR